jgi:hypothetical protein
MDSNLLHLLGGFRDLDFVEFGLRNFNHISAKSSFAVDRVLVLGPTSAVRKLFALDFPTVLVLAYRFMRLVCDEEPGCRFAVDDEHTMPSDCWCERRRIQNMLQNINVDNTQTYCRSWTTQDQSHCQLRQPNTKPFPKALDLIM